MPTGVRDQIAQVTQLSAAFQPPWIASRSSTCVLPVCYPATEIRMASRFLLLAVLAVSAVCCCLAAPAPAPRAAPRPAPLDVTSACRCTREFNAVCGNDGQTYSNKCLLECARAQGSSRMGQGLRMVKMGPC